MLKEALSGPSQLSFHFGVSREKLGIFSKRIGKTQQKRYNTRKRIIHIITSWSLFTENFKFLAGDGFLIAVLKQSHATHVEDWFGKTADLPSGSAAFLSS